ncbi:translin-like isoform X2 [Pomacea canaliculata]|uniref:translin-like isoform X2 n=1 Tax=Pomacea canaliculata TaxID=400727 RepID=UPI000D72E750|nr:translin-like isoform X2 [Pomacea canaliculata]
MSTTQMFAEFQAFLDADYTLREEIRERVRDLEQTAREIQTLLQGIHHQTDTENVILCEKTKTLFEKVTEQFDLLAAKIPEDQYYRFHDHWRFVMQRLAYLTAMKVYLTQDRLITLQETANLLGVKISRKEGFHLDLDDFLMGLLTMASELSRFAVNAVVSGDVSRPVKISRFLSELDSGFRLLNLKNDALRKRFDSLKYSVQKVEGVVYDLSIRNLISQDGSPNKPLE